MNSPWAHLPNASHIDAVLASVKAYPEVWNATWDTAWDAARIAAWHAARNTARNTAWDATRSVAWTAAVDAAREAAVDAVIALIAYDDCAHLLTSDPREVEVLARLGVPAAVLLLPACIAMNEIKALTAQPV